MGLSVVISDRLWSSFVMSPSKALALAAFAVLVAFANADGGKFAKCFFPGNDPDTTGHICFKQDQSRFKAHVHVHPPKTPGKCSKIGPHYNVPDPNNEDEGDLGVFEADADGEVHQGDFALHSRLNLSGENSIMQRSVAVHLHGRKICCKITEISEEEYEEMDARSHMSHHHD